MTRGTEDKIPKRCGLWSLLQAVCEWFELERYRLLDKNEWIWFELDKYSTLDKTEWLYMGLSKKGLEGCYFLPSDVYFLVVKSCCFRRSLKKFDHRYMFIFLSLFLFNKRNNPYSKDYSENDKKKRNMEKMSFKWIGRPPSIRAEVHTRARGHLTRPAGSA